MITETWLGLGQAQTTIQLKSKLSEIKKSIRDWVKNKTGNIKKQLQICRDYLKLVDKVRERRCLTQLEKYVTAIIKAGYAELAIQEEDMWR